MAWPRDGRLEAGEGKTHRAEGNSSGSQAYKTTVSCMRLMNGICILIAELVKDGLNSGIVLGGNKLADHALQSVCAGA